MPLTFPSSPINGAVAGDYTYDASKGAWRKNGLYPVSVTHSDVPPSNPRAGDQWWKSNEGTLFTYYSDGNSYQWVESTNVIANVEPNPIPAGAMMAWASDVIPTNWLLCDGTAVSRSTYASLFAIIGTTYGSGDGTTTFNLPNLKGKTIVGKDGAQTEFDVLGESGGAKTHTLTSAEMPSHTHTQDAHSHTYSGTSSTDGSHSHGFGANQNGVAAHATGGGGYSAGFNNQGYGEMFFYRGMDAAGSHSHTYSGTTSSITVTNQNTGGGGAHNNLQPYIVLNYIIKYSAGETPGDSQLAVRVGTLETQNNATPLGPNYIINGAFDVWQRGTSFTTTAAGAFTADRWLANIGAGATVITSRQDFTPGAAPTSGYEGTYYCRVNRTVTGSGGSYFTHKIEDVRSISNKTITVSFWAKASSNMSFAAGEIYFWNVYGTGGSSATGHPINNTATNVTTAWQRFSYTLAMPNLSGKTIGANSYSEFAFYFPTSLSTFTFDIWGVQVEAGAYATPFRRNAPSIQAEIAACQRYYWRKWAESSYGVLGVGNCLSAGVGVVLQTPVPMRAVPTSVEIAALANYLGNSYTGSNQSVTAIALDTTLMSTTSVAIIASLTSPTADKPFRLTAANTTTAYLGFSAEL